MHIHSHVFEPVRMSALKHFPSLFLHNNFKIKLSCGGSQRFSRQKQTRGAHFERNWGGKQVLLFKHLL